MSSDGIVIDLEHARRTKHETLLANAARSEDATALAFVILHGQQHRYVAPWHRWLKWDGKRWIEDSTGHVFALIRDLVRDVAGGTPRERKLATAAYVAGVERLARPHRQRRLLLHPRRLIARQQVQRAGDVLAVPLRV